MIQKIKRRRLLVHFSSQFRYIAMSVLPAFVIGIFSIYFLIRTGEVVFEKEKDRLLLEISSANDTIREIEKITYPQDLVQKVEVLKKNLIIFQDLLKIRYFTNMEEWAVNKILLLVMLSLVLVVVALMALIYSHRFAGPISRLKNDIDNLAQGKSNRPIQIRHYDEFKELATSLEKLRTALKQKGFLA